MRLFFLIILLFSATANAAAPDLTSVRAPTSTDLNIDSIDKYSVNGSSFKGRNLNKSETVKSSTVNVNSQLSRSISGVSSKQNAQIDNLESTAGEFVQKLDEDRFRKTKEHAKKYEQAKTSYTNAYTLSKSINTDNLGNEQDPYVQNAFKCKDLNNCDRGDNDPHAVPTCNDTEVLHWSGSEWRCLNQFTKPSTAKCSARQWSKPINNGIACVDYIYLWDESGTEACQKTGKANILYSCMKKKTPTDKGTVVSKSECKAKKPVGQKSCSYYGTWKTGSWSSCSKTCGSGTQTRSVTCSAIECTGAKPATSQACNTQKCVQALTWKLSSKHSSLYGTCSVNKNPNSPHLGNKNVKCHGFFSASDYCSKGGMLAQHGECQDYWDALFMGGKSMSSSKVGQACTKKGEIGAVRQGTARRGSSFTSNTMFYAANLFYECR